MQFRTGCRECLITAGFAAFCAPSANAQDGADEVLDVIIVTGTRRDGRTISESPVPVDVFSGEKLHDMGTGDMDDILRTLIPSYNVLRFPDNDETSLVRPATLRRLPPDYSLILVNGKRRHRSGAISGPSQGADMSPIPAIAIERLELLRDGASAQYGSDAVAGVLNFITRSNSDGIIAELETGQFYAGDGQAGKFSGNAGFSLGGTGFLNLSLEYGEQDLTSRSIQRPDAAALEAVGAPGIPNPAHIWGQPAIDDELKFFVNSAIGMAENVELYGFGNYSERKSELDFRWRNTNRQGGIYRRGGDRLVFDLTADGSGFCPQAGTPNAIPAPPTFLTQAEYDADVVALDGLAADPNCWVVNEFYPNGYKPFFGAKITDASVAIGVRGELDNGLLYDVSAWYGRNGLDYSIRDTINASLGPDSPTSFDPGETIQADTNFNVDVVLPVAIEAFHSALNVAAGFEWREESYETVAGEEASWIAGPLSLQGASIGSHGFPGYSRQQSGKWDRYNTALYLDLEADLTEKFTLGLAGRYEDFEDFGSTSNYKVAFRYRFNDVFGIRGAVSTGFRAPTPGQSNQTKLFTLIIEQQLQQVGLIPPTNPVAVFYGGKPLESEDAENLSLGLTIDPIDNLTITADYFRIEVENAISRSPFFEITEEDRATLIALGVPGASDFFAIEFNNNDIGYETYGYDIVASYVVDWQSIGSTEFDLAFNDTQSSAVSTGEIVNRNAIIEKENDMRYRGTFSVSHYWNNLSLQLRASYYDGWVTAFYDDGPLQPVCSDERPIPPDSDACYSDAWLFDVEAAYTFGDRFTVVVGADNVFDEYPELSALYPDFSQGSKFPNTSPFGFNGGFWYIRLSAEF